MLANALNRMVGNLKGTVDIAQQIAGGDLTIAVKTLSDKDSLGHALKDMVERLNNIVAEINISSSSFEAIDIGCLCPFLSMLN